ncbi:hypothetical protein D3C87_2135250 [compost metagenome]
MRSGSSFSERAMLGSAVLRMVPSSACMKKAMATIQGSRRATRGVRTKGSDMMPPGENPIA